MISSSARPASRRQRRRLLLVVVCLAQGGAVRPALAQTSADKQQARAHMAEGAKLLDAKDHAGALRRFEEAYRLVPSAKILFNIGVAKRALGRKVEALDAFEAFLDQAPFAPPASRAEAEKARDDLRRKLGFLEITVDEPGATVRVDGRAVGASPLPKMVAVELGPHQITVEKDGNTKRRSVSATVEGQKIPLTIQIAPPKLATAPQTAPPAAVVTPSPLPPKPPGSQSGADPTGVESSPPEVAASSSPSPSGEESPESGVPQWLRVGPWIAGGVTLLAVGAGFAALSARNDWANKYNSCGEAMAAEGMDASACSDRRDRAEGWQKWETVAFVGAGVFAIATVTLVVLGNARDNEPRQSAKVSLGCAPLLAHGGVTCAMRF